MHGARDCGNYTNHNKEY